MINNCGNCREGRKYGRTMVYCTFYGINIRYTYNRCGRHKPRIVEVNNENDESSGRTVVRGESVQAG